MEEPTAFSLSFLSNGGHNTNNRELSAAVCKLSSKLGSSSETEVLRQPSVPVAVGRGG